MAESYMGRKFGHLTAVEPVVREFRPTAVWHFHCACGRDVRLRLSDVLSGRKTSCGCRPEEKAVCRTPYASGYDRLHGIWGRILTQTRNPNCPSWHKYGGKGIQVCREWAMSYSAFRTWAESAGYGEDEGLNYILHRRDESGDYCPENCYWQATDNHSKRIGTPVTVAGETHTIKEWAEKVHTPPGTIYNARKRGIAPEIYIRYRLERPERRKPSGEDIMNYAAQHGWAR